MGQTFATHIHHQLPLLAFMYTDRPGHFQYAGLGCANFSNIAVAVLVSSQWNLSDEDATNPVIK